MATHIWLIYESLLGCLFELLAKKCTEICDVAIKKRIKARRKSPPGPKEKTDSIL
jgi:hypothetical protein